MKYILTSGCSFTNNLRYNPKQKLAIDNYRDDNCISWPYYLQKEVGDDFEVWNLGGATNDNVSIIRVLFYNIKELLRKGVYSEDIIVVGQWSDIHRKAIYLPSEWNWDTDLYYREHTLKYHKDKNGFFFLTGGFGPPDHKEGTMNVLGLNKFMEEYDIKVLGESYINETLQWLETWAFFENFCVDNDIDTYWFWMRNNLSQEAFDVHFGAPDMDSDKTSKNIWLNEYDILKPYLDEVSFTGGKIWSYKNYNGLLEWTYDNYGDLNPYQETVGMDVNDYFKSQPNKWGHPSNEMNEKFVKEELLNFISDAING
jgi:hypothetical protein